MNEERSYLWYVLDMLKWSAAVVGIIVAAIAVIAVVVGLAWAVYDLVRLYASDSFATVFVTGVLVIGALMFLAFLNWVYGEGWFER